jgi:hypothetical protein
MFPTIYVIHTWFKKIPITLYEGTKVLIGNPVFISTNRNAYAHPNILGDSFTTSFQDGTILLTKNYGDPTDYGPAVVAQCMKNASISELWTEHRQRTQALETDGKRVDRQISFQAYAEISHKETAV